MKYLSQVVLTATRVTAAVAVVPVLLALLVTTRSAFAADTSTRMENPSFGTGVDQSTVFANCSADTSPPRAGKGSFTQKGTKLQIKLSKLNASNTDGTNCARSAVTKHCLLNGNCTSDSDCASGQGMCDSGRCVGAPPCSTDADCTPGTCLGDIDDIICLVPISVTVGAFSGAQTMVLSGEIFNHQLKIKHDICKESIVDPNNHNLGYLCPAYYVNLGPEITSDNVEAICYESDPAWWNTTLQTYPDSQSSLPTALLPPNDCQELLPGRPGVAGFVEPSSPIIARSGIVFCQ